MKPKAERAKNCWRDSFTIRATAAGKPFIAVNCAAVPESLLESELFGHGRGAFTGAVATRPGKFELADGGTILLDEIGEMPLNLQPKLLRALQEREFERLGEARSVHVDIRVIATTNVSLAAMVERGQFRADLYYRLNVIPLSLPPSARAARRHSGSCPLFCGEISPRSNGQFRRACIRIFSIACSRTPGRAMCASWRTSCGAFSLSAEHIRDRCAAASSRNSKGAASLARPRRRPRPAALGCRAAGTPIRQVEKLHLEKTLALTDGNRTVAAEMLGISLRTLRNKIREYGLPPRRYA